MTLLDFIDDRIMAGFVKVYTRDGEEVGTVEPGDDDGIRAVSAYLSGSVIRTLDVEGGSVAYVDPPAAKRGESGPVTQGYPFELKDEAAFSLDWRSREAKASAKQLAFIAKHYKLYMSIKKDYWPADPKDLLRHEASDAMTDMLAIIRGRESAQKEA